jgi:hypothetical protein
VFLCILILSRGSAGVARTVTERPGRPRSVWRGGSGAKQKYFTIEVISSAGEAGRRGCET